MASDRLSPGTTGAPRDRAAACARWPVIISAYGVRTRNTSSRRMPVHLRAYRSSRSASRARCSTRRSACRRCRWTRGRSRARSSARPASRTGSVAQVLLGGQRHRLRGRRRCAAGRPGRRAARGRTASRPTPRSSSGSCLVLQRGQLVDVAASHPRLIGCSSNRDGLRCPRRSGASRRPAGRARRTWPAPPTGAGAGTRCRTAPGPAPSRSTASRSSTVYPPDVSTTMLSTSDTRSIAYVSIRSDAEVAEDERRRGELPASATRSATVSPGRSRHTVYTGCPPTPATATSSTIRGSVSGHAVHGRRDLQAAELCRPRRRRRPGPACGLAKKNGTSRPPDAACAAERGVVVRVGRDAAALDELAGQPVQVDHAAGRPPRPARSRHSSIVDSRRSRAAGVGAQPRVASKIRWRTMPATSPGRTRRSGSRRAGPRSAGSRAPCRRA